MARLSPFWSSLLLRWYFGPDHPAKIRLWETLWHALDRPRFTIAYAQDAWIAVNPHDYVDRKIIADGYYEPEVWQRLQSVAKSGDVFWDIGGHIGSVAIRAGEHPKIYAVHTFEPNPETFHALTLNLKLNPGLPITKHNVALSSSRDTGVLHTGAAGNSGRASMQRTEGRPRTVSCETIDHLVANEIVPPPDLMKLDVEGWESEVLRGAQWTLRTFPPRAIVFEDEPAGENDISDTFTLLNSVGYTIEAIERSSEEPVEVENYLALRSECTDLRCFED